MHLLFWQPSRKLLAVQQMGGNLRLRDTSNTYRGYLCSVQDNFVVIWCTCLKIASSSKMTGQRANRSKIGARGASCAYTCTCMGYIWHCSVRGQQKNSRSLTAWLTTALDVIIETLRICSRQMGWMVLIWYWSLQANGYCFNVSLVPPSAKFQSATLYNKSYLTYRLFWVKCVK